MKQTLLILAAVVYFSSTVHASLFQSSAVLLSVTFCTLNVGVSGWFGFFRRRKNPATAISPQRLQEMSAVPNGPVFPFSQGSNGFNSDGQFAGMSNQRFGNSFQGSNNQFQREMAQQMTSQQIPQHVQDQVFRQMQNDPQGMSNFDNFPSDQNDHGSPGMNDEEAESFFTLLSETDESQCISRLICEMGADPSKAGEFGQSISEIIGGLKNFPPGSKAGHYNRIMQTGKQRGSSACAQGFSACDNESLEVVRSAQTSER